MNQLYLYEFKQKRLQDKKIKIGLLGTCLAHGGANKIQALYSIAFENAGYEVYHILVNPEIEFDYRGEIMHLSPFKKGMFNRLKRFLVLRKFIQTKQLDYLIDFRGRTKPVMEYLLNKFVFTCRYIPTVHSYELDFYFPKSKWISKLMYQKAFKIVSISKAIEEKIVKVFGFSNVITIYNPIDYIAIQQQAEKPISLDFPYILAAGRMDKDNIKQFDKLIETYAKSDLANSTYHLVFLGDGVLRPQFEQLVEQLQLKEKIHFYGFQSNPYPFMKKAHFLVLCSKNEGYPTVLTEALSCGTPVISFDCASGPNEIIRQNENGLLVENQNFEALNEAMLQFIQHPEIYEKYKKSVQIQNDLPSFERFIKNWKAILT
ncbi:MAG: glycosyltransferase [Flavobacterium sp.]|jgi:N-acetylgalactosamine-N,N'-diacetylbacillosaminyl-diphospho-undecaprenol 4-alpha-N-acetylgalactosaminyltransferase|uniref:glycosyltransferase n=1 Tax=Flavobacterium sp. TaxID=239 RepID=UPI003BA59F67